MSSFHLDYETTSACGIKLGAYRYASDPTTRILMFAIAEDSGAPCLWNSADPACAESQKAHKLLQKAVESNAIIYAHNAGFELAMSTYRLLADTGISPPHIDNWRCTLAMCRRAAAPESLSQASQFFGLDTPKDSRGKALIYIFSDQSKKIKLAHPDGTVSECGSPVSLNPIPWDASVQLKGAGVTMTVRAAWDLFCEYCRQDVRVEQELHHKIRHFELKGEVLASFQFDLHMNHRGVPVNLPALRNADGLVERLKEKMEARFSRMTGLNASQGGAVKAWLIERGYTATNLTAGTVGKVLSNPPRSMSPLALEALKLRSLMGFAALSKIPTMIAAACPDGLVRGTVQWHAARTGRAGGRIIQPQNFKKSTVGNETHLCYSMIRGNWGDEWFEDMWESPLEAIASSIRHFIQPAERGFFDCDFSSVENKLLAWVVGDEEELTKMLNGVDMYKDMATHLFKVSYEDVTKDQRTIAKPVVLGCGYGVGGKSLRKSLEDIYRTKKTRKECDQYVHIYRSTHAATTNAWRELEDAAKSAVFHAGKEFPALDNKVSFRAGRVAGINYLTFKLPSGRRLYYPEPQIKEVFKKYDKEDMAEDPQKKEKGGYWTEELSYYGKITGTSKWGRSATWGSRWLENLCQAMGADLLDYGCQQAEKEGFDICMVIHDQILALENDRPVEELIEAFTRVPKWASTFPQKASGDRCDYYTKD